ncbi:hypothetical protein PHYSODRAFT_523092 [Phytophthora sojae]|uniref:Reverse transcriptase domain-containing protein n=1 Tax=Phytophthora sojae (strain P6497) TaxID=1094619 RepID=G5A4J1_PHYSP|nr:hypothetical protein PHYSODRAFT_523092 [Phytophthora sojae]EGZ09592.1 hypothetical protein PHYSODRAFT_523092 [Phytophthora sojae]|eukprot:XP_009534453.1 hypothetical protein PHYSODRAFT_523092 [Phytophthora sojae]
MDLIHDTAEATVGVRAAPTKYKRYDDPVLAALTEQQRALQIRIYHDRQAATSALRRERNAILHQIQFRCRELANLALDEKIQQIERLSPTAQMFEAVREATRTRIQPLLLHAVWTHRWLCARIQRYQESIHVLGIDLSRAFDTIDRHKLLEVLRTFLTDDDVRLIRLLLANTTLALRSGRRTLDPFIYIYIKIIIYILYLKLYLC